jgi:DNA (cytosine-5)-methyltransferase 1
MRRKLTFIDLFCGAGGWSEGFKAAGLRHVGGVDNDRGALLTYMANHGSRGAVLADIADLKVPDLQRALGVDTVDVVAASPPCQGFSSAGPRRVGDPNDRLSESVPRIARGLGAHTIVLENVSGMATKRDASGMLVMDGFLNKLRRAGFGKMACRVIHCEQHGVPQTRKRMVIVAVASSRCVQPDRLFPFPSSDRPVPTLRDILDPREQVRDDFYWMDARKAKYYEDRHASAATRSYVRFLDLDRIAYTVRARYAKSRGAEALVCYDDGRMRMLTEKECARIQSFPETYVFVGARTNVYVQIGNAVPLELARRIGRRLMEIQPPPPPRQRRQSPYKRGYA